MTAVVGGAAESGAVIAMARKNQIDLAGGIAMGSCLQIALFVAPVLVLSSRLIAPEPLALGFQSPRDRRTVHGSADWRDRRGRRRVELVQGRSAHLTFYLILAAMFYLIPAETTRTLARLP